MILVQAISSLGVCTSIRSSFCTSILNSIFSRLHGIHLNLFFYCWFSSRSWIKNIYWSPSTPIDEHNIHILVRYWKKNLNIIFQDKAFGHRHFFEFSFHIWMMQNWPNHNIFTLKDPFLKCFQSCQLPPQLPLQQLFFGPLLLMP